MPLAREDIRYINTQYHGDAVTFLMAGITYPSPGYTIRRTCSECCVMEYVRSGHGYILDGERRYDLGSGDFYMLPQGHTHVYGADPADPYEKIWVNASGPLIVYLQKAYGLGGPVEILHAPVECRLMHLHRVLQAAQPISRRHEWGTLALHALFLELSRSLHPGRGSSTAQAIRQALDERLYQRVRLDELAASLYLSRTHMIRLFRQHYHITPYQYLLQAKLRLARSLLVDTRLSIREISNQLAFTDESYFSKAFRAETGYAPAEYRRLGGPA